jgi:hypothetical protein
MPGSSAVSNSKNHSFAPIHAQAKLFGHSPKGALVKECQPKGFGVDTPCIGPWGAQDICGIAGQFRTGRTDEDTAGCIGDYNCMTTASAQAHPVHLATVGSDLEETLGTPETALRVAGPYQ